MLRQLPFVSAILLCLPGLARAAQPEEYGFYAGAQFGCSLLGLGDLNEDGVEDFAVGAATAGCGNVHHGRVLVLSGADRKVLQVWKGEPTIHGFGLHLSVAGDVDGDGIQDAIVGYGWSARTEVRSGGDGKLLLDFDRRSEEILALGDANGDGHADLLLVDRWGLEIRDGRDGVQVIQRVSKKRSERVHGVGDLDGDGLTDLVIPGEDRWLYLSRPADSPPGPKTRFFPRENQRELKGIWPEMGSAKPPTAGEPWSLVAAMAAGDMDGDGNGDLLLSMENKTEGIALVLSIHKLEPLLRVRGEAGVGYVACSGQDFDGEGHPDILLGRPVQPFALRVGAHSGLDGKQLWEASWDDRGGTARMSMTSIQVAGGKRAILVGSFCEGGHGAVCRIGGVRAIDPQDGKPLWVLFVNDVPELGQGQICAGSHEVKEDR